MFGEWVAGEVTAEPLFDPAGDRVRGRAAVGQGAQPPPA